jgi:hypothetical protein
LSASAKLILPCQAIIIIPSFDPLGIERGIDNIAQPRWRMPGIPITCNPMTQTPNARRVERRREKLRAQGLRPVQIWVPDTRHPGFAEEARRQGKLVGASYSEDELEFWERIAEEDLADAWR